MGGISKERSQLSFNQHGLKTQEPKGDMSYDPCATYFAIVTDAGNYPNMTANTRRKFENFQKRVAGCYRPLDTRRL